MSLIWRHFLRTALLRNETDTQGGGRQGGKFTPSKTVKVTALIPAQFVNPLKMERSPSPNPNKELLCHSIN